MEDMNWSALSSHKVTNIFSSLFMKIKIRKSNREISNYWQAKNEMGKKYIKLEFIDLFERKIRQGTKAILGNGEVSNDGSKHMAC